MTRIVAILVFLVSMPAGLFAQVSFDVTPTEQTGQQVLGSYFSTSIDSVSLTNGNLYLTIPVFNMSGRELGLHESLTYNSRFYEKSLAWDGTSNWIPVYSFYGWNTDTGLGGGSLNGNLTDIGTTQYGYHIWQFDVYWIESNGTKHHFYNQQTSTQYPDFNQLMDSQTLQTTDSEFITINTGTYFDSNYGNNNATIWLKNGATIYLVNSHTGGNPSSWSMTTPNGNQFSIGSGSPTSYLPSVDTVGRTISYSNNSSTNTSSVTFHDANGQAQVYQWQMQTLSNIAQPETPLGTTGSYVGLSISVVSSVTLPNGQSYQITWDTTKGVPSKVTLPSGAYTRYTWARAFQSNTNGPWEVTSRIVSPDGTSGSEQTWTYAYVYNEVYAASPLGNAWPSLWQGDIMTTTVTDPTGTKVIHTYANDLETKTQYEDASGTVLRTVLNTWNTSSNPAIAATQVHTDFATTSNGTVYGYDSYNNVTGEAYYDYDGSLLGSKSRTFTTIGNNLGILTNETLYNPDSSVASKTDYAYDEYSLTVRSSMPDHSGNTSNTGRGNLTSIKRYKNATTYTTEHLKYDNAGNVVEKDDALGHATLIDFTDKFVALVAGVWTDSSSHNSYAYPTQVTNPLSQSPTTKYEFNTGLPAITTNLRSQATTMKYEAMNRLTSIVEPNGKATTYAYDDTNRKTTKEVTVDSASPPNKGHVETCFDDLYRVIRTLTNDPEGQILVDTTYDSLGRAVKVTNPYRATATDCASIPTSGSASAWTYTAYDAIGRVICTSVSAATNSPCSSGGPTDAKVQYVYGGNTTTTINEAGNQRRYTYNALGKMVKVEEPNPTLTTPLITTYTYELTGPIKTTNQSGQTRTLTHDWLGRETQENLPESGITNYTYDDAGHMLTATDARGIVTTYTYDYLGRATQRSYTGGTPTVSFGYDATIGGTAYTGLRTSMTDAVGTVSYAYDSMNRLTKESRGLTGITGTSTSGTFDTLYAYNIKGDLTQMTYPSGRVVNFGYATNGGCCNSRLSTVADGTTGLTIASGMTYEPSGAINARTLNPNGSAPVAQTFTYNSRLQQTQVRATEGSTDVMNLSYGYGTTNDTGELLSRTDAIQPEHSVNYTYDSIYRLSQVTSADASWGIAWTFDAWGNRLSQTVEGFLGTTIWVGSQPNLGYTNNRLNGQTYDAAGNVTNDGGSPTPHTYTYNGKNQITRIDGSSTDNYLYDGEGRRAEKIYNGVSTFYFYGPGNAIISEFTSTTGATVANSSDKTAYQTSDSQGTAVLLIASNGLVLENNRTLPYGELWCPPVASANTTKFTTYERDQESNLDYAMNRYLSNNYGRFMSSDKGPVATSTPGSLNRYSYVLANPVNSVDPDGNACGATSSCMAGPTPPPPFIPPPPVYLGPSTGQNPCIAFGDVNTGTSMQAFSPCEGMDDDGGGSEPPKPAICDSKILDPAITSVFSQMGKDLNIDPTFIMAIAVQESGWNLSHVYETNPSSNGQPLNNLFGLTNAGGNNLPFSTVLASAQYWEKDWGPYLANNPTTISGFLDDLLGTKGHKYNDSRDYRAEIEGGMVSGKNGKPTRTVGTYQSVKNALTKCDIKLQ